MKSVCAKHDQAFDDSCPYCEKKAEGPTAAPAAPPAAGLRCDYTESANTLLCGKAAAWGWTSVATGKVYPACGPHHAAWLQENSHQLEKWTKERLP